MKIILNTNTPSILIDTNLDKLRNVIMFPEKLKKANEQIDKIKLPKKGI